MKIPMLLSAAFAVLALPSCMTSRSDFTPDRTQTTVGMPAKLSDRERSYIPTVDGALRNEGYLPVRHGMGDMQLEFEISEGPINTDTLIELREDRRVVAEGRGRAAGAPMIGRSKVADKSFNRAYDQFRSSLPDSSHGGGYGSADGQEYTY